MSKIFIGIHGMNNKPPRRVLEKWWKKAIREGFKLHRYPLFFFKFKLVYWADILHPVPLDPKIQNPQHPLFIKYPYSPGSKNNFPRSGKIRQKVLDVLEKQMDKIFLNEDLSINFSSINDLIIRRFFKDLDAYYRMDCFDPRNPQQTAKQAIQQRLIRTLKKYRRHEIFLITHSMGSIVAFDVLSQLPQKVRIDTLATIGSPLGFPVILSKISLEQKKAIGMQKNLRTPDNIVRGWYNFADLRDSVAMDYNLGDDFFSNRYHVKPIDHVVVNNYEYRGVKNPHKSYGYLRSREMAALLFEFYNRDRNRLTSKLRNAFNRAAQIIFIL
ncbi:MAG: hypothetical protein SCK70_00085 [bacterium]|nr:hypothetical protein [bacterium]